ncbi:unnamed protein product [Nesidiocoris tenuis]|uniref:Uncharacterized protein n=1 Tax=Nesidiocoris tenuis TaxID=355587 RepID=A0A6H5GQV7_9HEMI|nr:unnamed protein product [Nesidiocoris tenuis]
MFVFSTRAFKITFLRDEDEVASKLWWSQDAGTSQYCSPGIQNGVMAVLEPIHQGAGLRKLDDFDAMVTHRKEKPEFSC